MHRCRCKAVASLFWLASCLLLTNMMFKDWEKKWLVSLAGTRLVGLVPVTTGSSHITVGVVVEAEGPIMEGMVTWATGIRTVMVATQEVRIGGTKVHHATTKLLLFWCLVTVTWVNHFSFFCHWWNKFNWKLLHWQNLALNHLASFENCWRRLLEWPL